MTPRTGAGRWRTFALGAALLLVAAGPPPGDTRSAPARIGRPAPDFALVDTEGRTHRLSAHRGRIVVLEWVNPDCPIVQRVYRAGTMPRTLERLEAITPDVTWLAVNSTGTATAEQNAAWARRHGLAWPVLRDADGTVGRRFGARRTPHLFVIDADGILRYHGAIDDDRLGRTPAARITNYVVRAVRQITSGKEVAPDHVKPYGCAIKYAARDDGATRDAPPSGMSRTSPATAGSPASRRR